MYSPFLLVSVKSIVSLVTLEFYVSEVKGGVVSDVLISESKSHCPLAASENEISAEV